MDLFFFALPIYSLLFYANTDTNKLKGWLKNKFSEYTLENSQEIKR